MRTECVWCRSARHRLRRVLGRRCIPAHVTPPFAIVRATEHWKSLCESQAEECKTPNQSCTVQCIGSVHMLVRACVRRNVRIPAVLAGRHADLAWLQLVLPEG